MISIIQDPATTIRILREQLAEAREALAWHTVVSAPVGEDLLVCTEGRHHCIAALHGDGKWWSDEYRVEPTHWMRLTVPA